MKTEIRSGGSVRLIQKYGKGRSSYTLQPTLKPATDDKSNRAFTKSITTSRS
jgi:hypothetical protein